MVPEPVASGWTCCWGSRRIARSPLEAARWIKGRKQLLWWTQSLTLACGTGSENNWDPASNRHQCVDHLLPMTCLKANNQTYSPPTTTTHRTCRPLSPGRNLEHCCGFWLTSTCHQVQAFGWHILSKSLTGQSSITKSAVESWGLVANLLCRVVSPAKQNAAVLRLLVSLLLSQADPGHTALNHVSRSILCPPPHGLQDSHSSHHLLLTPAHLIDFWFPLSGQWRDRRAVVLWWTTTINCISSVLLLMHLSVLSVQIPCLNLQNKNCE